MINAVIRGLILLLLLLSMAASAHLRESLAEMSVELVPRDEQTQYIVRDPDAATIIIHSIIPAVSFESNNIIQTVEQSGTGEYLIHVIPGTHILTIKADGHLQQRQRVYIPRKTIREIRISIAKYPN